MKRPLIRNTNIQIWSKKFSEEIEDPYVILNVNPHERTMIAFGDNEIYVTHGDFVVSINELEEVK